MRTPGRDRLFRQGDPDQARLCLSGRCRQLADPAPVVLGAILRAHGTVVKTRSGPAFAQAMAVGGRAVFQRLLPGEVSGFYRPYLYHRGSSAPHPVHASDLRGPEIRVLAGGSDSFAPFS